MFQALLSCCVRDFVDEGVDETLDTILGQTGTSGISLSVCRGRRRALRAHPGSGPRAVDDHGGLLFQPNVGLYLGTRLKPAPADWIKTRNPLEKIVQGCRSRDLNFRARVSCCDNSFLAGRHGAMTFKSAFGEASSRWLCPVNPDVRSFLTAVVTDVSSAYSPDAITLEACGFPTGGQLRAGYECGVQVNDTFDWLWSLCFCESCQQGGTQAGVTMSAAQNLVQKFLSDSFSSGAAPAEPVSVLLEKHQPLRELADWRTGQVSSLLHSLADATSTQTVLIHDSPGIETGIDLKRLDDAPIIQIVTAPQESESALTMLRSDAVGAAGFEVALRACPPGCPNAETLVAGVKKCADNGVSTVRFYEYSLMPTDCLAWVRRAVRWAAR